MHAVSTEDIERQKHWEGECITMGLDRYRAAQYKTSQQGDDIRTRPAQLGETPPGTAIIRDICHHLIPAVTTAREEAIDGLAYPKHTAATWWWLIAWLRADALAYLTARVLLSQPFNHFDRTTSCTSAGLALGLAVQDEIEYRRWRTESQQRAKAAKDAGDDGVVDIALLLMNRVKGDVTRRQFGRWRSRIAEIGRLDWTTRQRLSIGIKLIQLAVEQGGGWIEVRIVRAGSVKTERRLALTEDARAAVETLDEHSAYARPYLMPMIAPPQPWERSKEIET